MSVSVWMDFETEGLSKEVLLDDSQSTGFLTGPLAQDVIRQPAFTVSSDRRKARVAHAKLWDLGFRALPTIEQVQTKVLEKRFLLCLPDVPIYVHRNMRTQTKQNIVLWFAMQPIVDSKGMPRIFRENLHHDGSTWCLHAFPTQSRASSGSMSDLSFQLQDEFVFMLPG